MKIDRAKLNTLLKSGLNPNVKTRKHLAAQLGLDPTSLTRWFASRDRLGNPRYPVVPDRHVANILQIFDLEPESLTLDDEKFRQHCLEVALRHAEENDDNKQKALLRLENIARRKLTLPVQSSQSNRHIHLLLLMVIVFAGMSLWWSKQTKLGQSYPLLSTSMPAGVDCWTGYSESLGSFDALDKADPCHYGKLFHNALEHLKASNDKNQLSKSNKPTAITDEYILFLSKNLEQRRIDEKITLYVELGRRELNRPDYSAAVKYFKAAEEMLLSSPNQNPKLSTKISNYIAAAISADLAAAINIDTK